MKDIVIYFDKKIDFLTYQLKQQYYDLSENELKLVVIFYLKGISIDIKKEIVKLQIFKSLQVVENQLSKLRKKEIIKDNKVILKYPLSLEKELDLNIKLVLGVCKELDKES